VATKSSQKGAVVPLILIIAFITLFFYGIYIYLFGNPFTIKKQLKQFKEEQEQEKKYFYLFRNSPHILHPTYLPPNVDKPVERDWGGWRDKVENIGLAYHYSCNGQEDSFSIIHMPISRDYERVGFILNEYRTNQLGVGKTIEEVSVNGKPAYFLVNKENRTAYNKILGWETDKTILNIWGFPNCDLPKEELIKVAESMQPGK